MLLGFLSRVLRIQTQAAVMSDLSAILAAAARFICGQTARKLPPELADLPEQQLREVVHGVARAVAALDTMPAYRPLHAKEQPESSRPEARPHGLETWPPRPLTNGGSPS
jgi:hypothetical protein